MHIYDEIMTMFLFLRSTRVDWLVAESSRLIHHLLMWIRTILFAVGVRRLMFPFMHAISRTDTFKDKKLIEPYCIVFQLKVFQKELQAERFWHHVRIAASIEENVQRVQFCPESNSTTLFSLRNEELKIIAMGSLLEGAEVMNSVLQQFLVG